MTSEAQPEKLTLWDAIKDLGWFPLAFAVIVGGPSILAILEEVFVNHQLVPALQWIVDGYNRVMAVLGAVVEPLLQPAIDWVNARLNWSLTLDPVWRPLFALGMIIALSGARTIWRDGNRRFAITVCSVLGIGALFGATLASLVPSEGGWWAQGLRAAVPLASLFLMEGFIRASIDLSRGIPAIAGMALSIALGSAIVVGAAVFALAAGLFFVPGFATNAGTIVLAASIATWGMVILSVGLAGIGNRTVTRAGLTILGGFVAAGLILAADFALKALGAG